MAAARTDLSRLRNYNSYLNRFPSQQQSTYFEHLISEVFSHILHLPFYTRSSDIPTTTYRVTWMGDINPIRIAPPGPDAIARCHGFYLTLEPTLRTGARQWRLEFASAIRHCEDFADAEGLDCQDVFCSIVCSKLSPDTYRSIKSNPSQKCSIVPITISELEIILQTSILAYTFGHSELRDLLQKISNYITMSSSLKDFSNTATKYIKEWQQDILKKEMNFVMGIASYKVIKKIGRRVVSESEIITELLKNPTILQYLKIIGTKPTPDKIESGLTHCNLACCTRARVHNIRMFELIHSEEFKLRIEKFTAKVNEID